MSNIVFMTIITRRKRKSEIICDLIDHKAQLLSVVYSRDYVEEDGLQYVFGLVPDDDELMLNCIMPEELVDDIFDLLSKKYGCNSPDTGMAFTVSLDQLSF